MVVTAIRGSGTSAGTAALQLVAPAFSGPTTRISSVPLSKYNPRTVGGTPANLNQAYQVALGPFGFVLVQELNLDLRILGPDRDDDGTIDPLDGW